MTAIISAALSGFLLGGLAALWLLWAGGIIGSEKDE